MNYQDLEYRIEELEEKTSHLQDLLRYVIGFLIGGFLMVIFKKYF